MNFSLKQIFQYLFICTLIIQNSVLYSSGEQPLEISTFGKLNPQNINKINCSFGEFLQIEQELIKNIVDKFSLLTDKDESEINNIITEANYYIKTYDFDKQIIWKNINKQVEQKIVYHQSQLGNERKLKDLIWLAGSSLFAINFGLCMHLNFQKSHTIILDYNEIVQDLKKINIIIGHSYWHLPLPRDLDSEQIKYFHDCTGKIKEFNEKLKEILLAQIINGIGVFLASRSTVSVIRKWSNVEHEKQISKFQLIHDKIKQHKSINM